MRMIVPRQALQDSLTAAATLVSARSPKVIYTCGKLAAEGETLRVCATDGEAGLHLEMPVLQVKQAGETVVPIERLLSIVREMTDVELLVEADERYCTIRGEGSEFRIYVMNPADFPPVPDFREEPDLVVDGRVLRRMIHLTLYAAAREMSRYAINGVQWEKRGNRLYLVATDGRRLARAGGDLVSSSSADFEVIVPSKALAVYEKVFTGPRDDRDWHVELKVLPNQILLRSGERVLSTVLVEGQFPAYERVIPQGNDRIARLGREEFSGAVRRAALLTTEDARAVRLSFSENRLVITSQSPERGEARVQIPIEFRGQPLEIGFNPAFLSDALGRMTDYDQVTLELQESFRPGVLSGSDKEEFLYVVMPVSSPGPAQQAG